MPSIHATIIHLGLLRTAWCYREKKLVIAQRTVITYILFLLPSDIDKK